jgi:hypothetical protein
VAIATGSLRHPTILAKHADGKVAFIVFGPKISQGPSRDKVFKRETLIRQ